MKSYTICQKVRTTSLLEKPIAYKGFTFAREDEAKYHKDGDTWLVTANKEANDFIEAYRLYADELIQIVDGLSTLTQCSFSLLATSYTIQEHSKDYFYFFISKRRQTVGIMADKEVFDDLNRILSDEMLGALQYFRLANNAATIQTRLNMLVQVTEALAGRGTNVIQCSECENDLHCQKCKKEKHEYHSTSKENLKKIMGEDLYTVFYKKPALRHKLSHGSKVDRQMFPKATTQLHDKLIDFMKQSYGLKSLCQIKSPPRTFNSSAQSGLFLRCTGQKVSFSVLESNLGLFLDGQADLLDSYEEVEHKGEY